MSNQAKVIRYAKSLLRKMEQARKPLPKESGAVQMARTIVKAKSHMFKITVEQCIDSEDWVWSLVDSMGGVFMDGYEATEAEAWVKSRNARAEVEAEIDENQEQR